MSDNSAKSGERSRRNRMALDPCGDRREGDPAQRGTIDSLKRGGLGGKPDAQYLGAPPEMTTRRTLLSEIADRFEFELVRDGAFAYPAKILTPVDDILVPFMNARALDDLTGRGGISAVIATEDLASLVPDHMGLAVAASPLEVHDAIHRYLAATPGRLWADFKTVISPSARVHPTAVIPERNVRILDGAEVMALAVIGERVVIGPATRIHSHACVGAEAYEIVRVGGLQRLRPQTGGTIVGHRCEVLSGTVISSSAFAGSTEIGDHVVLDGNVTVSHDCIIGDGTRVGGGSWLGGRVSIGRDVSVGPGCTIGNGLRIGDGAKLSLGAVVTRDVEAAEQVSGNFAVSHSRFIEHLRSIR